MKVRPGVMFPDKPGVMKKRELTADDIVFAYTRLSTSPKKIAGYFDHVEKVEATDKSTVVFTFKHFNAEWDYRFGWGYYSTITPKEVADAGATNWKNVNGTGPYMLTDFVQGSSNTYTKNPDYWDKETVGGTEYKLPFIDKITYRTIKDEATFLTALRTGKLDLLESIRWRPPTISRRPRRSSSGRAGSTCPAPSVDAGRHQAVRRHPRAPCAQHGGEQEGDRQAYYGGNAELFAYPQHPDYLGYFEPLDAMPDIDQGAVRATIPTRRRSCSPRRAIRRASASRSRSARATPTTWTCCRWSPPISSRSA